MIRSMQVLTSSQLKRDQREDKKKSMLSRPPTKARNLSRFLSTTDWRGGTNPKLPDQTKKILEYCDSNGALGEIKSLSKQWTEKISKKEILLSFLANGYAANDITKAPGR